MSHDDKAGASASKEIPRQSEWLTADEAAAHLKVKTRSLLRWVRLGQLQAYTLSGTRRHVWRFRKEDL